MPSVRTRSTSITVSKKTRRRLQAIKARGESYDELIQVLLEESDYDDGFYAEIEKRWNSDRRIPSETVFGKFGSA